MLRRIGGSLVIATHNKGKLREIAALLEPIGIACVSAEELGLPEPEEIGNSFLDNADLKAREAADLPAQAWLAHPQGFEANAAVPLVNPRGEMRDAFVGPMAPTPYLEHCPYVMDVCRRIEPKLLDGEPGHAAACHLVNPPERSAA